MFCGLWDRANLVEFGSCRDLNADDTSTDTESLINGFDDFRIQHQRPSSMMIGGVGNGGSGSMRRGNKPVLHNSNFSRSEPDCRWSHL